MMEKLEFLWNGGETRRYHGFRMLMEDTVGHHSYNVACTIMCLRPNARAELLRAALKHDAAEHLVGDMPAPTKRALPNYVGIRAPSGYIDDRTFRETFAQYEAEVAKAYGVELDENLTDAEKWVLKLADAMDGMRFCINERALGNGTERLRDCFFAFRSYVRVLLTGEDTPVFLNRGNKVAFAQSQDLSLYDYLERKWEKADER